MKTPLTWKLYEDYKIEQDKKAGAITRFMEREQDASRKVQESKSFYDALIYREVTEGIDLSKEKTKALENEQKASVELEQAKQDRAKASAVQSAVRFHGITQDDLFNDWHNTYIPMVKEQEIKPLEDYFRLARARYLDALLKVIEIEKPYDRLWNEHSEGVFKNYRRDGAYRPHRSIFNKYDLPHLKDKDFDDIRKYGLSRADSEVLKAHQEIHGKVDAK